MFKILSSAPMASAEIHFLPVMVTFRERFKQWLSLRYLGVYFHILGYNKLATSLCNLISQLMH